MQATIVSQNGTEPEPEILAAAPFKPNVQISFKSVAPLNIEIDIDALTVADLEFVERLSSNGASTSEIVGFLSKVIPGTDINTIPIRALPLISNAVISAIGGESDPNDSAPG